MNERKLTIAQRSEIEKWLENTDSAWFEKIIEALEDNGATGLRADPLTAAELRIIQAVSFGLDNQMIAETYHISIETVKGHLRTISVKLGAKGRAHICSIALRRGLIS